MPANFLAGLDDQLPGLTELYRDLHAHPELAFQEVRTADIAARRMAGYGYEVTTGVGRTGVVGVLRNGDGPVVMLRADMDALPVREDTGLPYASTGEAVDSVGATVPVMHACGHDMHVVTLLGACALMARNRDSWRGTIVAVFQPGEESGYGARSMVDDGLFTRFPRPVILLGQHVVAPAPAGIVAHCPGTMLGATDSITVRLFGQGGHGAKPEATVDPVVLAASLVSRLQTIVSREISAQEQAVVTVGYLKAGTTAAVIPDHAELGINVRTFSASVRDHILAAIERMAQAESMAARSPKPPEIIPVYHLPATVNDPAATERVIAAHEAGLGRGRVIRISPASASEDFSVLAMAAGVPSVYWFVGGVGEEEFQAAFAAGRLYEDIPLNHSAKFAPVIEPTLSTAIASMVAAAADWLDQPLAGDTTDTTVRAENGTQKVG